MEATCYPELIKLEFCVVVLIVIFASFWSSVTGIADPPLLSMTTAVIVTKCLAQGLSTSPPFVHDRDSRLNPGA